MLEEVKKFVEDFYNYTIEISITESELFSHYEWLENMGNWLFSEETLKNDYKMYEIYVGEIKKDMLYDLLYNQESIKSQLINDVEAFGVDSDEFKYIKDFYNKWKHLLFFEIKELK